MPSVAVFGSSIPALLASLVFARYGYEVDIIHQGLQQPQKKSLLAYAINSKNMEFLRQFVRLAEAQPVGGLRLFFAENPSQFPPQQNYMTIVPRDRLFYELSQAILQNSRIQTLDYNRHAVAELCKHKFTYAKKHYDYAIITHKSIAEDLALVRQKDYSLGGKIGILLASAKLQKPHKTTAVQLMNRDFLALLPLDAHKQASLVWSSLSPQNQQPQTKEQLAEKHSLQGSPKPGSRLRVSRISQVLALKPTALTTNSWVRESWAGPQQLLLW